MKLASRTVVDDHLDRIRHGVDRLTLPKRWWQPVETLRLGRGNRETFEAKWAAIAAVLDQVQPVSALDVGCNAGAFTIALAARGIVTLGVERDAPFYRAALLALRRSRTRNAGVAVLDVTPETTPLLPHVDCTLFLAVWHHVVRLHGLEHATTVVRQLWERTGKVLFFVSGENELGGDFGLPPLDPTPRAWFERYLGRSCPGGTVRHLGLVPATAPDGTPCTRNLFAVLRADPEGA